MISQRQPSQGALATENCLADSASLAGTGWGWRGFEVVFVLMGAVVLAPVFFLISLAILLGDGPPVFFSHERVGKKGQCFHLWKFRTMVHQLVAPGSALTAMGDPRVTRVGRWLRRFKLDELPQLFNVLKGEMSLVGPRPEVPRYVELKDPIWRAVLEAKPGITDLATLVYRDEERVLAASGNPELHYCQTVLPAKLRLNLQYLRSRSVLRDLQLILLTIRYSFLPWGFDPDGICRRFSGGVQSS